MTTSPKCPRCDAPLFQGDQDSALRGLCPLCLLQAEPRWQAPSDAEDQIELEEIRRQFPELEVLSLLGRGGMGVVYRARQPRLDRFIALKVLAQESSGDPTFTQRFLREARAMAKLNHPNIVQVFDFGEQGGRYFLLMELVEGRSLRQLMQAGELDPAQVLTIVPAICQGLQYAHENGVVHRDIKPENILIDQHGTVKILDFGLAKLAQTERLEGAVQTRASQIMGTPHYMAPEQVSQPLSVDHRADIYSVGVVFYELLTGDLPVGAYESPSERSDVDARVDAVVQHALEREPDRRYQAAEEVRTDVEHIAHTEPDSDAWSEPLPPELPDRYADDSPTTEVDLDLWDLRAPPLLVGSLSLAAAWIWIGFLLVVLFQRLAEGSPDPQDVRDLLVGLAVAYPLAFLGARAGRVLEDHVQRNLMMGFARFTQIGLLAAVGSGGPTVHIADLGLEVVAGATLFVAHQFLNRWIREKRLSSALFFAFLVIGASIAHSAWSEYGAGREAFYYSSGMISILGLSSTIALLPLARTLEARGRLLDPLARSLIVALIAACTYFNKQLF